MSRCDFVICIPLFRRSVTVTFIHMIVLECKAQGDTNPKIVECVEVGYATCDAPVNTTQNYQRSGEILLVS